MAAHVALLGDSILDNGSYTGGEPDVAERLRRLVGPATVTLLAVDGTTTAELGRQVERIPADTTHAVVSIGGNDGILETGVFDVRVGSVGEALELIAERAAAFEDRYRRAVLPILERVPTVGICTIYTPRLAIRQRERIRPGLAILNDVIARAVASWTAPLIDLRFVMTDEADFANELEPSSIGAAKIARAAAIALGLADVRDLV